MPEFSVNKNLYSEIDSLNSEAKELLNTLHALERAKISVRGAMNYAGILTRISRILTQMQNEKRSLDDYAGAIEAILSRYERTERLITADAKNVVPMKSKKDYVTDREVDAYIANLDKWIVRLLKFFGLYEAWKERYKEYLERYRLYLYDKLDVVYVIDPLPKEPVKPGPDIVNDKPNDEPPKEEPPKQDPPKEDPPKQDPPKQDPPKQDPPKQDPPKPPKKEVDRTPDYSNKVFDNKGQYGARQALDSTDKDLYEAMRQANPNLTDKQCAALIKRLKPEGCAYAGMTNIIMRAYEGRAEDFENYFGFSMYKNGDLNYDALTAYIYARFDDPNMDGLTPGHMGDMLDIMVPEMGNNYNAEYFYEPDYNNIPYDVEHGVLAFSTQGGFSITSTSGKVLTFDEAHYMTVTGITGDGRLIVSSWGQKYYIDPSQYDNAYYTYFTFDTIP